MTPAENYNRYRSELSRRWVLLTADPYSTAAVAVLLKERCGMTLAQAGRLTTAEVLGRLDALLNEAPPVDVEELTGDDRIIAEKMPFGKTLSKPLIARLCDLPQSTVEKRLAKSAPLRQEPAVFELVYGVGYRRVRKLAGE